MRKTQIVKIGDVVSEFFSRPYVARKIAEASLPELWAEVVGKYAASATTRVEYKNGVMCVWVSSSAVRHELFMNRTFLRDEINRRSRVHDMVRELVVK